MSPTTTTSLDRNELLRRLTLLPLVSEVFPPCSDVMLALAKTKGGTRDDISDSFEEYFIFASHEIFDATGNTSLEGLLETPLLSCVDGGVQASKHNWPPSWCLPPSCVTLTGKRTAPDKEPVIKRLFIADVVWLFYYERMGIFQILGVILDDFATKGRIPFSNGSVAGANGIRDQAVAVIMEAMVRQTKMGLSSTVRDRDSSYRRCLGWTSEVGRKLGLDSAVNNGFNSLFHKFIQNALEYYKDKRLAVAIRGSAGAGDAPPSVATLITIRDTIDVLKKTFESFDYGRNYNNTLSGIVWVIAGMSLIRELRSTLGIPNVYADPHEFIPAAYDLLVMKKPTTPSQTNRYTIHRSCARDARDLLLDILVVNQDASGLGGELDQWLTLVEARVEGYRTAYRALTGVDLGAPGTPVIEQQV